MCSGFKNITTHCESSTLEPYMKNSWCNKTSEVQDKGCGAEDPPPYSPALIQSHHAPVESFPISSVVPSGKLST
jgi:hypothetical protein